MPIEKDMVFIREVLLFLLIFHPASACFPQARPPAPLLTVAEESDFTSTSTSAQVVGFVNAVAGSAPHVNQFGFGETIEGRQMVGVTIAREPYEFGSNDDRAVALILGNIHSGECAGKEAILMMMRELAGNPDHRWLDNLVLVFIPNYNADANDRMGKQNRPGQMGPEQGMGRRENAQDLDLNRDFVKLESPEARALVRLIDQINPHLFIDCHTTNGSQHQYSLTYDIPHNPATAEPIRNFLRRKMMPVVTQRLQDQGTLTFYYGNFNRDKTVWRTFGHEPRYSTEYVGLRGRLGILSEAYSYISYKERIFATRDFVSACLEYLHENADSVVQLLDAVDSDLTRVAQRQPSRVSVSLNARAEKFDEQCVLKGYKQDQPHDYQCDFIGKYVPTRSVPLPYAYLIPQEFVRPVDRLLMHGIQVGQLEEDTEIPVTINMIQQINRQERAFQKHRMLQVQSQTKQDKRTIPKGTYVVTTAQPLSRLATYLLECESDDGLVFWNFFDRAIEMDQEYPVFRVDQPMALPTSVVMSVPNSVPVTFDMIGGPNSVIPDAKAPRWVDGNQIEIELYNRKFRLDPETTSFQDRVPAAFQPERLRELLQQQGIEPEMADELASEEPLESKDRSKLVFDTSSTDFVYLPKTDQVFLVGEKESPSELFEFSPDENRLAYVNQAGLNILDLTSGEVQRISADDPENQLLGKLDWVYQEELYGRGQFKGYWWSPNSRYVAFLKLDQSNVGQITISDHIPYRGDDEIQSYPKAGDPNPAVAVGIADVAADVHTNWIDLSRYDDDDLLVSHVSWQPESSRLFLQIQNRTQTYLDLLVVDASNEESHVLFRDQTPAWIESPGAPGWLSDGSFLWLSPRSGHRHLYHYDSDGKLRGELTRGEWEVRDILDIDPQTGTVYLSATKDNPHDMHAWRLDVGSGTLTQITSGEGSHRLSFNDDMTHFIDAWSQAFRPVEYRLYRNDGTFVRRLAASSDDRWNYLNLSEPEFLTIPSPNGQPLDAMVIRPPNFDPSRQYPVLIHTYAGPHAPQVRNRFGGSWSLWHQMLAQAGYVIFKCDSQSASYRSARQVWPIHRDLGRNELADLERAVSWLKQQSWIDGDRIGIWGWSYGGYMAAYALTHSDSFKIGIAGAPVTDWRNYDTIYTERLMGLPSENEAGYDASSVVKAADNLSGRLLLIHGSIDDNVHLGNTMQLALALQKAGKPFEMMIYPRNRHAIRDEQQADHLRRLMFDFVKQNL